MPDVTQEGLKASILANLSAAGWSTLPGGFADLMAGAVATELWKYYCVLDATESKFYVNADSGIYIDKAAASFGLIRKSGSKSSASLALTGTMGVVIPAGTLFLTAEGLEFALDSAVTLGEDGMGAGTVTAAEVGSAYNVPAGAMTKMYINLAGVTGWQSGTAAGGADVENDGALYARLSARLQTPATSGNVYHYRLWALEVDGVGDAKVLPLWDGAGTVKVLLVDSDKAPVDSPVVTAAAAHIGEEAPIGATVTVESAEGLIINVAATVTIDSTTTLETVRAALESKLDTYLQNLAFVGYTLLYNRVAFFLLDIDGVVDYSSLTVNDGINNILIADNQVPVAGTVTVS